MTTGLPPVLRAGAVASAGPWQLEHAGPVERAELLTLPLRDTTPPAPARSGE